MFATPILAVYSAGVLAAISDAVNISVAARHVLYQQP
jgi:hypothetical protein